MPCKVSAYTSLGTLYDQVPGWPIGFGDAAKAEAMLREALRINPNGIDSNYFWADHLYRQKRYPEATTALHKALQAPLGQGVNWRTRAGVPISMLYSKPSRRNRTEYAAVAG